MHRKVTRSTDVFSFTFRYKYYTFDDKFDSSNGVFVYFKKIIKNGSDSNFRILKKITGSKPIWYVNKTKKCGDRASKS